MADLVVGDEFGDQPMPVMPDEAAALAR